MDHKIIDQKQNAFTLIEVITVMGVIAILATLGLVISLDYYRSYAFNSERDLVVSLLEKARSQSLANINQTTHGLKFENGKYILFEGAYSNGASTNLNIEADISIHVTTGSLNEVSFEQLSGNALNTGTIFLTDGKRISTISLSSYGAINW